MTDDAMREPREFLGGSFPGFIALATVITGLISCGGAITLFGREPTAGALCLVAAAIAFGAAFIAVFK